MIRKTIDNSKGIPASIWKIHSFRWEESGKSEIALYGWNENQNIDTDEPIDTRLITDLVFPILLPYGEQVYNKIIESRVVDEVELNEFAGSLRI